MSTEAAASSRAAPDRVFARAVGLVLACGLAVILSAHLVLERAARDQSRAAELALVSAGEAASARAVAAGLERLAAGPGGEQDRAIRSRLGWDVDRLTAQEDRRLLLTAGARASASSDLLRAVAEVRELAVRREPDEAAAAELRGVFEGQVLPQLDLIALRHRAEAERAAERGGRLLLGTLAAQLLAGATLFWGVVLPARRRIAAWVARSREEDRQNRFHRLHDPLTGMPNATYLDAYLARLAVGGGRRATQTAVMRIDLDRFKIMRETLGQDTCDEIIRIAARRIQHALRTGDFAAYLGQDDFVVVAPDLDDANDVAAIAARVQAALTKPFSIRGGARRITCGIGVTLLSDDGADPGRIVANANIALAAAKAAGCGMVRYFRESLRVEVERRETLFTELLAGLDRDEIVPHFQPQIDLVTGAFAGVEALVRWQHPRDGLREPGAFLDFAEQTDLTERIGEVVLTATLQAMRSWDAAGLAVPRVGVNFALAQLRDPRLIEKIKWETERFDVDPSRVAIEVLETVLIKSDADMVVRNLRGLASAGFHVELDDFGTGHASISNLRRFMVDRIKIDKSFIAGIETEAEQQKLTASMIAMAHALGIKTLAEGVETAEAAAMLRELGCDFLQGYVVAEPMSAADTIAWIRAHGDVGSVVFAPVQPTEAGPNKP
jgi:diguanylate cyclase (GGDEF)-like protein